MAEPSLESLASGVLGGERRALGKAITLVESTLREHELRAEELLQLLAPHAGGAVRLGVSGSPGVGKSTFIEALGTRLVSAGKKVAVLAVDPSSSVSGGSILGDKTRMPALAASPCAFIRPSPTGGTLGGVARRTREAIVVCEAAGHDVVIVETVGVGQSELAVADMVDVFLLLLIAGAGDELQGIKRGIMELADVFCVNKADGDNRDRAAHAAAEIRAALGLLHPELQAPVLTASALEGSGIAEVWEAVSAERARLEATGALTKLRADQERRWFESLVKDGLEAAFFARPDVAELARRTAVELSERSITATAAARRLLALLDPSGS